MGDVETLLRSFSEMIIEKNNRYGNSALSPINIFTVHAKNKARGQPMENITSILVRLDDKLNRIAHSDELRKNDVADLMGYLTLLCVGKGWLDFSDLID